MYDYIGYPNFKKDNGLIDWMSVLRGTKGESIKLSSIPLIKEVIFNPPATIIYWEDGTKTVVKCHDENFDKEKGFAMACLRKLFGGRGQYLKHIDSAKEIQPKKIGTLEEPTIEPIFEPVPHPYYLGYSLHLGDFIDGKFVVNCETVGEAESLMQAIELRYPHVEVVSDFDIEEGRLNYDEEVCYRNTSNNNIVYGSKNFYENTMNKKVVEFKDLIL